MFKRPHYIAFAVVLLLVLFLLNLPTRTANNLKTAIGELFTPLFGFASSAQSVTAKFGDKLTPRKELLRQNEQLKAENRQLQLQVTQMADAWQENKRLKELLGFRQPTPWRYKPAMVIGHDSVNWWRGLTINLGSKHELQPHYPVLNSEGFLVGRVSTVSYAHSDVVLLGDPACEVAAVVEETRDQGMIRPRKPVPSDTSIVNLYYLSRHSEIKPGYKVKTSGLGGIFPSGILIGHVIDSQKVEDSLYTEARVRLAVDLNRLEEVFVKIP